MSTIHTTEDQLRVAATPAILVDDTRKIEATGIRPLPVFDNMFQISSKGYADIYSGDYIPTWLDGAIQSTVNDSVEPIGINMAALQVYVDNIETGVNASISSINTNVVSQNTKIETVKSQLEGSIAINANEITTKVTPDEAQAIVYDLVGSQFITDSGAYLQVQNTITAIDAPGHTIVSQNILKFIPDLPLDFGSNYTVILHGIVSDLKGNEYVGPTSWNFYTEVAEDVIELNGEPIHYLIVDETYIEDGATYSGETVVIGGDTVDTSTIGSYRISYSIPLLPDIDIVYRTINVAAERPPVFTIEGTDPYTMEINTVYKDPGVTARASYNCCSARVTNDSLTSVNITSEGVYVVTYIATDLNGNVSEATRVVKVVDSSVPIITLNGDSTLNLLVGETYTEEGATCDTGCTIIVGGDTVDTGTVGTYTVTYISGEARQVVRVVNVIAALEDLDTIPPALILLIPAEGTTVSIDTNVSMTFNKVITNNANQSDAWMESKINAYATENLASIQSVDTLQVTVNENNAVLQSIDEVTGRIRQSFEAVLALPPTAEGVGDLWIVTDQYYAGHTANNPKNHVKRWDGINWILLDPSTDIDMNYFWSGKASKLLRGTNGEITGWSFSDGSDGASTFNINANNFYIQNSNNDVTSRPFSIDTVSNKVKFNGIVDFVNTNLANGYSGTTTINGGMITADSISATQIDANAVTASEIATDTILLGNININQLFTQSSVHKVFTSTSSNTVVVTTHSIYLLPKEKASILLTISPHGSYGGDDDTTFVMGHSRDTVISISKQMAVGTQSGYGVANTNSAVVAATNNSTTTGGFFTIYFTVDAPNWDLTGATLLYNLIRMRR